MKKKVFEISLKPYPGSCHFLVCGKKKAQKIIDEMFNGALKIPENFEAGTFEDSDRLVYAVWLSSPFVKNGKLAHEVEHLTSSVLNNVGIKRLAGSEEAFAYMNQWITEQFHNHIKK